MIRFVFLIALAMALGGCSVRTCTLEGAYLEAQEYPDLQNPSNGELPARDPSYQLPPQPDRPYVTAQGYKKPDGEVEYDCLQQPPRLIPKQDS